LKNYPLKSALDFWLKPMGFCLLTRLLKKTAMNLAAFYFHCRLASADGVDTKQILALASLVRRFYLPAVYKC